MPISHARKGLLATGFGACALVAAACASIALGLVRVPLPAAVDVLSSHLFGSSSAVNRDQVAVYDQIVWQLRFPRTLAAALVGAALAPAGAVLQAVVRNPLAEPGILGISAGASLCAVLALAFGSALSLSGVFLSGPLPPILGALAALVLILALAAGDRMVSGPRVILAGVAVGQMALAATSFVQLRLDPTEASAILFWLLGSVAGVESTGRLVIPAIIVAAALAAVFLRARDLNVMTLGDEDALALGLSPTRVRIFAVFAVAALTGVAVGLAGTVGFLGLFVPHALRLLIGPDHRWLLPACAVWGAAVLVAIDMASRTIAGGQEIPLSVFTALVGGPFFLWLLRRGRRGGLGR
ncbi:FecCD family ABC transporter permease [Corynebacterium heidelbergense]|uniref:ABC transporter permease n=1 Tax=Corynebacterium heidelbergense TaxID=2055947 RepID=A0A364V973_9CORY|nr:iron ABC transporter permease [Corynebacterium heidelbergense]RAV33179.1 ABC transporter permease [Corynebacterium heidelbergense]WCZ35659.1 Hemin transport system permease protein HmuU [Corynebacterium heidelbergense]